MNRILQKSSFLFDLDGTLVDSSALHQRAFMDVLSDVAPELLDCFDYESVKGKSTAESFCKLGISTAHALDALVSEKQRRYRNAVLAGELPLMPGSRQILEFLRSRSKRLFLVTGASRGSVDAALNATGIRAFFEGIIIADDVASGKPAPDSYLLCLERFGISAAQAVGVEDSLNGLEACRAAGLDAVLVNGLGLKAAAVYAFPSFGEFRLALIHAEELRYLRETYPAASANSSFDISSE